MRIPLIRVKDKQGNYTHILGTDSHDTLHINEEGSLDYLNLQGCDGTGKHGTFEFVGYSHEFSPYLEIEFVTLEKFKELAEKEINEREAVIQKWIDELKSESKDI